MPEITLRDIYQSQQELLGSFKEIQKDQHEMHGSIQEIQMDQREMHGSIQEIQKDQHEMHGSLEEMQKDQRGMQKSIRELNNAQQETLEALHTFATHVDDRFNQVDKRFSQVDGKFKSIDQQFTEVRATMVTKDYLDNKLADLRGDLVLLARKGNTKLSTLVERLVEEKRLDPKVAHQILLMEPFPQA
jgi:chromosome segregation ATPase